MRAPNDETRGSLDAAKRDPGGRQSASLLSGYETATRPPLPTLQQQAENRGLSLYFAGLFKNLAKPGLRFNYLLQAHGDFS